ncbi:MAG: hypothetical protein WA687_10735 [Solirubrobacterales bacterium]
MGKTETIRQALAQLSDSTVLPLDLDGAASAEHVGFLLAKQIARAAVGETNLSLSVGGVVRPSAAERARTELVELLGWEGFEEALRSWPSGKFGISMAFPCLEEFARRGELLLWIDHLEAPSLTSRHPLKVDQLLWGVRDLIQRVPNLGVVFSGREGGYRQILGPKAAFHQQGQWLAMENPSAGTWRGVAERMGVSGGVAEELAEMTGGHPSTMLLGLLDLEDRRVLPPAYDLLRDLASRDDGLAGRAMQHARSLHRLGGQLMSQVAGGERPYAASQRGTTSSQEIRKALDRLRLAGLLRKGERWEILNPLIAIRLRGTVRLLADPGPPDEPLQS